MDDKNCTLEVVIDRILYSARDLKKKMDCANNNNFTNGSELSDLRICDLERENMELRAALHDHRYGLEFIMSKYRSQVLGLIQLRGTQNGVSMKPDIKTIEPNSISDNNANR